MVPEKVPGTGNPRSLFSSCEAEETNQLVRSCRESLLPQPKCASVSVVLTFWLWP